MNSAPFLLAAPGCGEFFLARPAFGMKKAKSKAQKRTASKPAAKKEKQVDMVKVRQEIGKLVGESAGDIAKGMIEIAKTGQLALAKYLFEAVGLYPASEETSGKPKGVSLAETLLQRLGLPLEPLKESEEPSPAAGLGVEDAEDDDEDDFPEEDEITKPAL